MQVLGIDLASRHTRDIGTAWLAFDEEKFLDGGVDVIRWEHTQPVQADKVAAAIDRVALARGMCAVAIDGPHAWRDPDADPDRPGAGRYSEYLVRCPGKTGVPGTTYPRTYLGWTRLSISVFDLLLSRPHVTLVHDELRPDSSRYGVMETFPTATWRAAGLSPLPAKSKASEEVVQEHSQRLSARFGLPAGLRTAHHDHLQAVVAALAAAGAAGGPGGATAHGHPAFSDAEGVRFEGKIHVGTPPEKPAT